MKRCPSTHATLLIRLQQDSTHAEERHYVGIALHELAGDHDEEHAAVSSGARESKFCSNLLLVKNILRQCIFHAAQLEASVC